MLRELLRLIVRGELLSSTEAARKLGTNEVVLDEMIGKLIALGYLEDLSAKMAEAACAGTHGGGKKSSGCAGCPMAGSCHGGCFTGSHGKVWAVTAKGRKAADEIA